MYLPYGQYTGFSLKAKQDKTEILGLILSEKRLMSKKAALRLLKLNNGLPFDKLL